MVKYILESVFQVEVVVFFKVQLSSLFKLLDINFISCHYIGRIGNRHGQTKARGA